MNFFSISDIENLTGIRAHTLRIWEQRYKLLNPKRKESKHRQYDNEDLKYILRIAFLYHSGYKISKIAGFSEEEIKKMALDTTSGKENYQVFVNQLTEASIDFDQSRYEKILHNLILHLGFEKTVTQILFPLLNKIGLLWMTDKVSPAQEHFASALVIKKILVAIDGVDKPPGNEGQRKVLLFAPEGEHHEIPLLFMQYLLKRNGVYFVYVGKNAHLDAIKDFCVQHNPTQLYCHLVTNLLSTDLNEYLKKISSVFPDKEIVFSGPQARKLDVMPSNIRVLKDAEAMLSFCNK
ncbi:MAG: MerR family transcriptional regulator [Chitinophagaceae bacterium]|nr:MerR family transcriptional regulator [Chitinophagaceae bacterium]